MVSMQQEKNLAKLLYLGIPAITVFLVDGSVTDPVNAPKFFILGAVAVSTLFVTLSRPKDLWLSANRLLIGALLLFVGVSTFVLVASPAPIVQSMYGVYGRNSGYLTYLFLAIIFFTSAQLRNVQSHRRVIFGLLGAGLINVVYCGWVLAFGEFLSWNNPYGNILGTLGNPNFIGAFLGIFISAWFAILLGKDCNNKFRLFSIPLMLLAILETYLSHAIQGRVLLAGGFALVGFYWIRFNITSKTVLYAYSSSTMILGILALGGALQKGPLTSIIYKNSVSLRGQYWLAGLNTGKENPLAGVGFDAFGDWYRRMRDVRAITLPGVNTVVNTAHNVPIDIFASGGYLLLISYLILILVVIVRIVKLSKELKHFDPIFVALVVGWVTYQTQSVISINQIGIAVWGWVFSGLIMSYKNNDKSTESITRGTKRIVKAKNEIIGSGLFAGVGLLVGALLAVPPLSADMKWRSAQESRNAQLLEDSLKPGYLNPQNTYKYLNTIQTFEQSNLTQISRRYALAAVRFNPESYDSWKFLYMLRETTPEEKKKALSMMKQLDPLNPDVTATQ